jgi:hypothetical protein
MKGSKRSASEHPQLASTSNICKEVVACALHEQLPLSTVFLRNRRETGNGFHAALIDESPHRAREIWPQEVGHVLVIRSSEKSVPLLELFELGRRLRGEIQDVLL